MTTSARTRTDTTVRLRCRAVAPPSVRALGSAVNGGQCGYILGDIPGPVEFIGLCARAPDEPDGRVWLKCARKDCGVWNVYVRQDR